MIDPLERWNARSQIVMRSIWDDRVQAAWPVTVVDDSADALVLYLAAGTVYKTRTFPSDAKLRLPVGELVYVDREWTADLLRIMIPGDQHAYLGFWGQDHKFNRWYVNLEREYRRTKTGIDFVDHFLDIVIQADLETWQWKDEPELREAVSVGLISQMQADAIQNEGLIALDRLNANLPPFGLSRRCHLTGMPNIRCARRNTPWLLNCITVVLRDVAILFSPNPPKEWVGSAF